MKTLIPFIEELNTVKYFKSVKERIPSIFFDLGDYKMFIF